LGLGTICQPEAQGSGVAVLVGVRVMPGVRVGVLVTVEVVVGRRGVRVEVTAGVFVPVGVWAGVFVRVDVAVEFAVLVAVDVLVCAIVGVSVIMGVAVGVREGKPHSFSSTETSLELSLAVTRSRLPSLLRSPTATEIGAYGPNGELLAVPKLPLPLPSSTDTSREW
jgi:hypothetical protein